MLPVFLAAIGDSESADFTFFPLAVQSKVQGIKRKYLCCYNNLSSYFISSLKLNQITQFQAWHLKLLCRVDLQSCVSFHCYYRVF